MVSIPELRELLSLLILIAGLSVAFMFVGKSFDVFPAISFSAASPTPVRQPRVLGTSTRVGIVANPVVHIVVPEHNIFELQ